MRQKATGRIRSRRKMEPRIEIETFTLGRRNSSSINIGLKETRKLKPLSCPGGASGKEPACPCRRCKRYRFDPWSGRWPGGGNSNPLQCSCLENPMDRGAWQAMVHRVTKSWTWLKWLNNVCHHMASIFLMNSEARWCAKNVNGDDGVSRFIKVERRTKTNWETEGSTGPTWGWRAWFMWQN